MTFLIVFQFFCSFFFIDIFLNVKYKIIIQLDFIFSFSIFLKAQEPSMARLGCRTIDRSHASPASFKCYQIINRTQNVVLLWIFSSFSHSNVGKRIYFNSCYTVKKFFNENFFLFLFSNKWQVCVFMNHFFFVERNNKKNITLIIIMLVLFLKRRPFT